MVNLINCRKMKDQTNTGAVLIVALYMLSFLSLLALGLAYYSRLGMELSERYEGRLRSTMIARGVLEQVMAEAWQDKTANASDSLDEDWIRRHGRAGEPRDQKWMSLSGDAIGQYTVLIRDESARVNLNTASADILTKFFSQGGLKNAQRLAQKVIAYRQKKPFDSVLELLSAFEIKERILLGEDTNENGTLDPWEQDGDGSPPVDNRDGVLDAGLKDHLTVFTDGQVNINTAPEEVLLSMPGMDDELVRVLVSARKIGPLTSMARIRDFPAMEGARYETITGWASLTSNWFRVMVTARAAAAHSERQVMAVVDRSGLRPRIRFWRENK